MAHHLENHKLKTKATNIIKEVFPSLIKQLWERGITAEHLQDGFRAAGLVPFNPKAVKPSQLAPSLVAEGLLAEQTTEGECGLAGRDLTTCERVSQLLPDTATCRVRSGRQGFDRLCTCVVGPS